MRAYLGRVGNVISQSINTIFLNGHPDECLSGRAYRTQTKWAIEVIDLIFFWDHKHCRSSYFNDLSNAGRVMSRHKNEMEYD
jgi:hypothetical protein